MPRAKRRLPPFPMLKLQIRDLALSELSRVGEIDRTERIDLLFEQRGTDLVARQGSWDSPAWEPYGQGEHSVESQRQALAHNADAGGVARGALSNGRLVGIGMVVPHIRPGIARLAYLHGQPRGQVFRHWQPTVC